MSDYFLSKEEIEELENINEEVKTCTRCPLFMKRNKPVYGQILDRRSDVILVSESPDSFDDVTGKPLSNTKSMFVVKLIREILGLDIKDINVLYLVKCFPCYETNGLTKSKQDVRQSTLFWCSEYFYRQLEILNPKLIIVGGYTPLFTLSFRKDMDFSVPSKRNYLIHTGKLFKAKSIFSEKEWFVYPLQSWLFPEFGKNEKQLVLLRKVNEFLREGKDLSDLL